MDAAVWGSDCASSVALRLASTIQCPTVNCGPVFLECYGQRRPVNTGRNRATMFVPWVNVRINCWCHSRRILIFPADARACAHIMGYYKCQAVACPTVGAEPAPAGAPLASAAPTRTAAVETMVAFARVPRRLAERGSRRHSSTVGSSGACNTGTAADDNARGGGATGSPDPRDR